MRQHDEELNRLAALLHDLPEAEDKRMFGGTCIMTRGNMIAGVNGTGGVMLRVGKPNMDAALALSGVEPMQMGSRTMGGYVSADPEDEDGFNQALALARSFVGSLPSK